MYCCNFWKKFCWLFWLNKHIHSFVPLNDSLLVCLNFLSIFWLFVNNNLFFVFHLYSNKYTCFHKLQIILIYKYKPLAKKYIKIIIITFINIYIVISNIRRRQATLSMFSVLKVKFVHHVHLHWWWWCLWIFICIFFFV